VKGNTLPAGWHRATIAELSLPTATRNPQLCGDGEFTYIDIEAIDNLRQRIECPRRLNNKAAPSRARNAVLAGDVIFSLVRPYLKNIAIVPPELDNAIASTAFFVCRPGAGVDSRYIFNFFRQDAFISSIVTYGNSPPSAHDDEFARLVLPIPPAKEQERIADALDELLSDLDAGVAALERARDKLKLYRAAVLKAAVEGALTVEWRKEHPQTEPASELLKRILAERRRRWEEEQLRKFKEKGREPPKNWKAGYQEPVAYDPTELPELPPGWILASMDAITLRITSGSRDWQRYYGSGTGTFVMAQNVRPGRFDASHRQPVNPPANDSSCERSRIEENDLLVTIVGANTGDLCRIPEPLREHYVCQSVALMRPVEKRTSRYLELYYNAQNGGLRSYRRYIYGAGRPHLSFDQLKMTPVAIPPIEEQEAIIEAVEDQLSVIDHLESDLNAKLTNAQALRQSILRDAFSGKLVPQDPNDEPASELLKRIAAEREQRARGAAAAKRLNGHKPRRASKPRGKAARAKPTNKKEPEHGPIADR
jgi:type I restriction enzyme S subunit